jgi:TRAP-type transport system periplasmic protein
MLPARRSFTLFALAATLAAPLAAQEVTLKVHRFWPPGAMGPSTILVPWCDKIAKESGNRMKCQIYPAMQLGGTPQNLRMRAPTRQTNKMLAALGATPVAMPLPALPKAISKGVIDGYLLPWEVIPSIKAHELTKYESETDPKSRSLYTAVFIFAMNQAKCDALPADLKKVIDANSGLSLSNHMGQTWDGSAPPARKLAVDRGNVFHTIPAAELDDWQKATANLPEEWVKDVSAKGNDGKALLQTAKELIRKRE